MTQKSIDLLYFAEVDTYNSGNSDHYIEVEPSSSSKKYLIEFVSLVFLVRFKIYVLT